MNVVRALGELAEAPGPEQARTARLLGLSAPPTRAEYTDLFVVQLYPYASVYLSADGRLGGQVQEHIAGFWRIMGERVPRDPDHIATLLSTYARLTRQVRDGEQRHLAELTRQMRHAFFWEHLASWIPPFLARVRELGSPAYREWASLVLDALEAEAVQGGQPAILPFHLRNAAELPGPGEPVTDALFSPARSGLILTRADLTRCARDLGISVRIAERRYTLQSLLVQDTMRVASWLASEARRQAENLRNFPEPFRAIASHWEQRALATANLIGNATIRDEVRSVQGRLPARD